MDFYYRSNGTIHTVSLKKLDHPESGYQVSVGDDTSTVELIRFRDGELVLRIEGRTRTFRLARDGARRMVHDGGSSSIEFERVDSPRPKRAGNAAAEGGLTATTPAQVMKILVAEGDLVSRGDALLVLEAMKMEFRITAPKDGKIAKLGCAVGEVVERGQLLIDIGELS